MQAARAQLVRELHDQDPVLGKSPMSMTNPISL
jgi:hypothetical protein